jgi:CheY-like chemotaxis protein
MPRAKRVLFVDDDESLRELVSVYLTRRGYSVETAVDGAEGLQKIVESAAGQTVPFDLLITDVKMPELDGIGLVRALRDQALRIPIIVCSSEFTKSSLDELRSLFVTVVLPKSSMVDLLPEVVEKVMRTGALTGSEG